MSADGNNDDTVFFDNAESPTSPSKYQPTTTIAAPISTSPLAPKPPQPLDDLAIPSNTPHLTNLDLINTCDTFPYYATDPAAYTAYTSNYYHLLLPPPHTRSLGLLLPSVASIFANIPGWDLDDDAKTLILTAGHDCRSRSDAVAATVMAMRATGHFEILTKGWRGELYPVYDEEGAIAFEIERAASSLFGVVTYGCHMTVYVRRKELSEDGEDVIKIWVPRRARTKSTYPGMLDNSVAGGIAAGESPRESLVREAAEEATLPQVLVREKARAAGTVSYFHVRDERAGVGETRLLQPECQYVYDLEVDDDVVLKPGDDEVEGFELMSVEKVKDALARGEFKPNCALVLLDFFVRHGVLSAESESDYVEIVGRLHRFLEFPTAKLV